MCSGVVQRGEQIGCAIQGLECTSIDGYGSDGVEIQYGSGSFVALVGTVIDDVDNVVENGSNTRTLSAVESARCAYTIDPAGK